MTFSAQSSSQSTISEAHPVRFSPISPLKALLTSGSIFFFTLFTRITRIKTELKHIIAMTWSINYERKPGGYVWAKEIKIKTLIVLIINNS